MKCSEKPKAETEQVESAPEKMHYEKCDAMHVQHWSCESQQTCAKPQKPNS